jgi:hypothetical protein
MSQVTLSPGMGNPIPVSHVGNLHDAFEISKEIEDRENTIKEMQIEIKELAKIRDAIGEDYRRAGIFTEDRFLLQVKESGRRTVIPELVKEQYPEVWDRVKQIRETCTLVDLGKYLPGLEIDQVCKKTDTISYEIVFDWTGRRTGEKEGV